MRARNDNRANLRSAGKLSLVVLAMFGFGFALVPLYDVFCEITGLNGKTGVVEASSLDEVVDETRLVTVEFTGSVNSRLPWAFAPIRQKMKVHPGKIYDASFIARNLGPVAKVGQAVPSVSPATASRYFDKIECFCFSAQRFESGEERELPLRFVVDTELPEEIKTVTLSYTFFERDENS